MEFRVFTQDPTPDNSIAVPLDLTALGFSEGQECRITEMWKSIDMGVYTGDQFAPVLRQHASGLYRVSPVTESVDAPKQTAQATHVSATKGGLNLTVFDSCQMPVYLLDGALVKMLSLETGTHFVSLPQGRYVVGGQVVAVAR